MPCRWRELLVIAGALTSTEPGAAQQIREIGVQAIGTFSDPAMATAGGYGAIRTTGRTRFSASLGAGIAGDHLVFRGELLGHFLLSPEARGKAGFYLAGGIAGVEGAGSGAVSRGYLVLTLGVEARPGARSGWAVEAGVGGGVRVAVGYRWRWFSGAPKQ